MVDHRATADDVFRALSDATRRAMLERLALGETTVGDLGAPFPVSFQAVSKHVKVLEAAGLVSKTRRGRTRRLRLVPRPLRLAERWAGEVREFWERRLDALDAHLRATARRGRGSGPRG